MTDTHSPLTTTNWRSRQRAGQPTVFTIPSTFAFVDALAAGLMADASSDPLALAHMTVLLPTRRACRSLREAFLRLASGAPLLPPRMMPLNDLDEDDALFSGFRLDGTAQHEIPPAIDNLRRQMLLAALIMKRDEASHDQAIALAEHLARLIDQLQTEGIAFSALATLVPDDYAVHWQETLRFLEIIGTHWPEILTAEGCIDPVDHRNRVFAAQAEAWRRLGTKLDGPIIAAGSTGSIPATAALLQTVAHLPQGCIVLPGLDQTIDENGWNSIDESHPQYGLKQLIAQIGITRDLVETWPGTASPSAQEKARLHFISEVMRPAASTDAWTNVKLDKSAADGLHRLTAPTVREEAGAIAMALRDALNVPDATCALVTPDRELAQRVASEMLRWNIVVDDSGGDDLARRPVGAFLQLIAEMVATDFAPIETLSVCKHPFAALGLEPADFRELTREVEVALYRGPRPAAGLDAICTLAAATENSERTTQWADAIRQSTDAFVGLQLKVQAKPTELLDAHMRCAEAMAHTPAIAGPLRLWAGDDGEAAAQLMAQMIDACAVLPPMSPNAYPAFFAQLLRGRTVRPKFGQHPRLSILGPLEARLQRFDTVILAGLNEGTWPATPAADPWLSRPMRARCGLPSPERRVGLAAHDIAEALCAPAVILSRSLKVGGAPSVPSRWLMRLDQVLAAGRLKPLPENGPWLRAARAVTAPATIEPWPAPKPTPPVTARPRALSVTEIETWMRDPYGIYAKHILKLRALDPIDADVSSADYGTLIHKALQMFVELKKATLGDLIAIGRDVFGSKTIAPAVFAFWWPRFQRIAAWFVVREAERRDTIAMSFVERAGTLTFHAPAGPFVLRGKADRIDMAMDSSAMIIDYKTGTPPSSDEVVAGFAPQLPLEAAMVLNHSFKDISAAHISALTFWQLTGRDPAALEKPVKADALQVARDALAGLQNLVATYDRADTPYPARPRPEYAPSYSDYEHLARVKEWATSQDSES
jgi:ATP-dependent helicase/nuclease subunit B